MNARRPPTDRRCESGSTRKGRCRGVAADYVDGMWLCASHAWLRRGGISKKERRLIAQANTRQSVPRSSLTITGDF